MKKILFVVLSVGVLLASLVQISFATTIANYNVQGSFNDDYDIWVGVGETSTPTWSQRVAWTGNGNWAETHGSLTVPDEFVWDNTWWLKADDNWGADTGSIIEFSLLTAFGSFSSPDVPVYIPDTDLRFAYINMPTSPVAPVPEPSTFLLLGGGLAGLAFMVRRRKKE